MTQEDVEKYLELRKELDQRIKDAEIVFPILNSDKTLRKYINGISLSSSLNIEILEDFYDDLLEEAKRQMHCAHVETEELPRGELAGWDDKAHYDTKCTNCGKVMSTRFVYNARR